MEDKKAVLYLEDGTVFEGRAFGAIGESVGEVVFNTAMTGYQEVLTDPSYAGQIVTMTHPEIGNYGTNRDDQESRRPFVRGFVVRECSPIFSSWRGQQTLDEYLKENGVCGISEIDTRALVRRIREVGAMRGVISSSSFSLDTLRARVLEHPSMKGSDYVRSVTISDRYEWPAEEARFRVVAYDYGIKKNILRSLARRGCESIVVPATTSAEDVLALNPDGIFLSNGPGDPEPLEYCVENVRKLVGKKPIFGICLGHQILGLAFGGSTFKLKFGHRGANQPVKNLITGKVEITCQNHGFAVDADSLKDSEIQLTHINLNDQTLEGLRHRYMPVFSVQYHPEASPGPHDSYYLFDEFIRLMEEEKK
ncbi:MAG TPA: glutamine-hydrolyzing carbamoyl-phosphate synthase small subunit [Acidobacteriota bacterium]|nr:glutamine-hydrolyzing carbamoyl-phosphate synthase small subunit [Acidobacteriota bacterium]